MLEPGDPDYATFGGGSTNGGGNNGVAGEQNMVEDELDAFNDETFGGGADEWAEDAHEELAQLTEEERKALKASNDFFEFGSDDGGELGGALEDDLGGALEDDEPVRGPQGDAADQLLGALKPKPSDTNKLLNGDISATNSTLKQQFQNLNLGQVAAPLTIETAEHGHAGVQPAQVMYQHQPQPPPIHIIHQPQFQLQQQQQIRYSLVPPTHFQGAGDPHHQHPAGLHHQVQGSVVQPPFQDPAIMSFSKIPVIGPFPAGSLPGHPHPAGSLPGHPHPAGSLPGHPHPGMPGSGPLAAHQHQQPGIPVHQLTGGQHVAHGYHQQHPPQPQQQLPPTVMGFKTMQDLENEMLYGKPPNSGGQGHQGQPHQGQGQPHGGQGHMHQQPPSSQAPAGYMQQQGMKQQLLNNRNLNYPGMRDRQQQQVKPMHEQSRNIHDRNFHNPNFHGHGGGQGDHRNNFHAGGDHQRGGGGSFNQLQQHQQQHNQHQRQMMDNRRHQADEMEHRYNQNQHQNQRRTEMNHQENNYRNDQNHDQNYRNQNHDNFRQQPTEQIDDNNWRWNEVRNRNRDSATRKDLMPGHVHTLGILRHSRARHVEVDLDDDCLGESDTPLLVNPTGDPALDARLAKEQEELTNRARWFNDTEDEYAGLMTDREKKNITYIQLSQLKCDNPYVDDYYYTMFTAKKQKLDESERTGQMLLSDSSANSETNYRPMQFENSLGKLQAVSVKAPRQIIDLPVVRTETDPESPANKGVSNSTNTKPKRMDDYKSTLLQLEGVYSLLLDVESLKLKLSAIPTGVPLREQVTMELTRQVQSLANSLSKSGMVTLYLQIRKGRELIARALKHLPNAAVARISQEMLVHLWLVCKDAKSVDLLWHHLYRHSSTSSLGNLEAAVNCWVKGKDSALNTMLSSPLGVTTVLAALFRATTAAKRGQEKITVGVWRELMLKLITWHTSEAGSKLGLAKPLVTPQPMDIGFLLTLPDKQLHAWEDIMVAVGLEK